jgi:L-threonylcarbamoyladenylate synthase
MTEHVGPPVLGADDPDALDAAQLALTAGGIVGLPTETVYGLAVMPRPESLKTLIAAKQRPEDKGVALLIDGLDQIDRLVVVSEPALALAVRFWPGALTLVLPIRDGVDLPEMLTGGRDTLAMRLADHAVPRTLARRLGPLAVSSANRSGERDAITADELVLSVGASLALVLDGGRVSGGRASTVVAIDADGAVSVLREGALEQGTIEQALDE